MRSSPRTRRWPGSSSCWAGRPAGRRFVPGGTIGNLSALVAARHTALTRRGGRPPAVGAGVHGRRALLGPVRRPALDVEIASCPRTSGAPHRGGARAVLPDRPGRVRGRRVGRDDERRRRRRPRDRGGRLRGARGCGCTWTVPTAGRRWPRRASGTCSTGSSAPTASSSTRTSGSSRRSTAAPCSTGTPSWRGRRTRRRRAISITSTAIDGNPGTSRCTCRAGPAACRSGSAWPRTGPSATPPRSSSPWRRPPRSPPPSGLRPPALVGEPEPSVVLFERPGWDDAAYAQWSHRLAKEGVISAFPPVGGAYGAAVGVREPETRAERVIEVLETLR